jgi:chromosome segregation ATPase
MASSFNTTFKSKRLNNFRFKFYFWRVLLAKKIAEKIPTWISRFLLPEIRNIVKEEISNQLKPIDAKISALDSKIEERTKALDMKIDEKTKALEKEIISLRNEMNEKAKALDSKISALEAEISSLRNEMNARFDSIEKRLPLIERIALLEARMEKIEKQIGIH